MAIRDSYPIRFTPKGLSDAYDSTDAFAGACTAISNLIFDQYNPEILVSRPGVSVITSFAGFTSPGVVSVHAVIGTLIYGMISTARNPGKDEPFCYDTAAAAFIVVAGVTNANSPTTQATTGAWTPPTMAMVGVYLLVTHPGFSTGANKFGRFDLTNPAAPVWSAGTTTTNALPSVPTSVANFNNRAYYACGNVEYYSDVLVPLTITNASQTLTVGDATPIVAQQGLAIEQSSAGVASGLLIWKGSQIWQVTGDTVTSNLSLNYLSLTIGTSSPRSLAFGQNGVYFLSVGGPYMVTSTGLVEPVTYDGASNDPDIKAPFQNCTQPTRAAAGYSAGVYRCCLPTVVQSVTGTNDYWFDERKRRWTGPHSFAFDGAAQLNNYFVLASVAAPGMLFKSQCIPDSTSVYTDNGTAITSSLAPSSLPKLNRMTEKQVVETTVELSSAAGSVSYSISAYDQSTSLLGSAAVVVASTAKIWGLNVWGDGSVWSSSQNVPKVYSVPWSAPLVFKKLSVNIAASSSASLSIGTLYARYQDTGYRNAL